MKKRHLLRKSGDSDFQGRRRPWGWQPWAVVAGDHGPRSPATLDFGLLSYRLPVAVSWLFLWLFRFCFLLYFSLTFLLIYWLNSSEENLSKGCANQSTKFPSFWKSRRLRSRFSAKSCN
ncbi:hypothetical protein AAC387_Pa10g0592 [Persea americana]